jgi:hypothetical protein
MRPFLYSLVPFVCCLCEFRLSAGYFSLNHAHPLPSSCSNTYEARLTSISAIKDVVELASDDNQTYFISYRDHKATDTV